MPTVCSLLLYLWPRANSKLILSKKKKRCCSNLKPDMFRKYLTSVSNGFTIYGAMVFNQFFFFSVFHPKKMDEMDD